MQACTVTGTLRDPSNTVLPNTVITFDRRKVFGVNDDVVIPKSVTATSDANGAISVVLYSGQYIASTDGGIGAGRFVVGVPDAASANFADIINQEPVITPSILTQTIAARDAAEGFADAASGSVTLAAAEAASAEVSAEAAAAFAGFRDFADVTTLLANTSLAYGTGANQVAAGNLIRTRAEGFAYEVAASAATDQHVTTAGGVKLYVLADSEGARDVRAFGALGDGASDSAAALQVAFDTVSDTYDRLVIPSGTFRSTTALDATGVRVLQMDGEIYFDNNTDGLTIGRAGSVTNDMARCDIRVRVRGPIDVAGITGVICRGMWRSEVSAHVDGFEFGFEHRLRTGLNEYIAGCTFNLTLRNCRVKLRFDIESNAFCSDNRYPGLVATQQSETLNPTVGVEWVDNTGPCNNNIFDKAWLENNDTPILFAGECSSNKFWDARLEGSGDIVFTTGGQNGGAANNIVTASISGDELSTFSSYTTDSPFPNFVDSGLHPQERSLVHEITWRDWIHRTATANRNYFCPKLISTLYGNAGGFTFGVDYFDWATISDTERSFTITNNDEGYFDVPVKTGDQFELNIHHDESSVSASTVIVRLVALDATKTALGTLAAGALPYIGTGRHSTAGTTGTGNTASIQNDRARLSTGVRINRDEVSWMRVVLRPNVEFYKVFLVALHDRYSRPTHPKLANNTGYRYIDGPADVPDFNGQLAKIRGSGRWTAIAIENQWRGVGYLHGRAAFSSGTVTVTLPITMPSTAYHVIVSGYASETVWVSAKTTTTFTISSSNASSAAQVEYIVNFA
jgi:hypothetical protein